MLGAPALIYLAPLGCTRRYNPFASNALYCFSFALRALSHFAFGISFPSNQFTLPRLPPKIGGKWRKTADELSSERRKPLFTAFSEDRGNKKARCYTGFLIMIWLADANKLGYWKVTIQI